jgi:OmpA-OmpF porin, OOP family
MKNRLLIAAAAGALMTVPAVAQADEGWYFGAAAGYGGPGDSDVSVQGSAGRAINGKGDWRQALSMGYDFADSWRVEAEAAHRFNDTGAIGGFEASQSDFHIWSLMVNLFYEFSPDGWVHPYLGGGLGFASVDGSLQALDTGTRLPGPGLTTPSVAVVANEQDVSFVWQLIAGVGWHLGDNFILDTQYRYFSTADLDYTGFAVDALAGHEAWMGLRYVFNAPPPPPPPQVAPPPPPVAPPPPPRPTPPPPPPACDDVGFVVYFEWDRSNLTSQAQAVINQAISQARSCGVSSVAIDGHADRSGSASYNVGLSERRARAVRDEMVRLGVPASAIALQAFGESRPAVQTPDGVREPLNRRSEVLLDLR